VAPESAAGGPLSAVQTGDRIRVDFAARRLDLLVGPEEMQRRRAGFRRAEKPARGYARLWADHVLQADQGCDFDFLRDAAP
jgi:dihydroxy-acid dehydratase